jgi:plasmid stability protein
MTILQIRGVDDADLDVLRERARRSGVSLSTYLRTMLHSAASNPTRREVMDRIAASEPVDISAEEIVELITAERPA